jgi:hypothetical protein
MYIDIALELLAVGTLGQGEVLPSWMGFPLSLLGLHIPRPFNVIPDRLFFSIHVATLKMRSLSGRSLKGLFRDR